MIGLSESSSSSRPNDALLYPPVHVYVPQVPGRVLRPSHLFVVEDDPSAVLLDVRGTHSSHMPEILGEVS